MNDMNVYGFNEQVYLKSWTEETREWREHEHTHLVEVEQRLTQEINEAKQDINNNIDAAESAIVDKIEKHNN